MGRNAVPSKKIKKGVGSMGGLMRLGSTFGGGASQRGLQDVDLSCFDRAEVQVPATPVPKKKIPF
jgi:hypothetical protein